MKRGILLVVGILLLLVGSSATGSDWPETQLYGTYELGPREEGHALNLTAVVDGDMLRVRGWGGEAEFGIQLSGPFQHRVFKVGDGVEWMFGVIEKPPSAVLSFSFYAYGCEFFVQNLSTDAPDSVIESIAVYHASCRNIYYRDGGVESYRVGKMCHIYRSKAWDALGREVWCRMESDLDGNRFRIVLPDAFWRDAVYPVVVDPYIGYTTQGATSELWADNERLAHKHTDYFYTATTGDQVTACSVYTNGGAVADTGIITAYTVSAGVPNSRVYTPDSFLISTSAGWYGLSGLSHALSNGTQYCVAIAQEDGAGGAALIYKDATGGTRSQYNTSNDGLPATWSAGTDYTSNQSMYLVVTNTGGAAPAGRRRKLLQMGWLDEERNVDYAGTYEAAVPSGRPSCFERAFLESAR